MTSVDYRALANKELPQLNIEKTDPPRLTYELLKIVAVELFLQKSSNKILIDATRENLLALESPEGTHNFEF